MARNQDAGVTSETPFPTYRVPAIGARRPKRPKIRVTARRRIFARDEYRCRGCGAQFEPTGSDKVPFLPEFGYLTIDHIIPVSSGLVDFHDESNMRALCEKCNGSKGART